MFRERADVHSKTRGVSGAFMCAFMSFAHHLTRSIVPSYHPISREKRRSLACAQRGESSSFILLRRRFAERAHRAT